jgi:hypothetical protein
MSHFDKAAFKKKLDELSRLIHAREKEFRQQGEFLDIHRALLEEIRQRNDALMKKVAEAEHRSSTWELVKAELARDYSSLLDDLLQFGERLDAEIMKQTKE